MVNRISGGTVSSLASVSMETIPPDLDTVVEQIQPIQQKIQQQSYHEQQLPKDKAIQLTDSMNKFLETTNTQLRFNFHEKLNEYYVTIVDSTTDEVIREIPSKKLLDIHAAMREFVGILVDKKI